MPAYYYNKKVTVAKNEAVILSVEFPDNGTAAEHRVDLYQGFDLERYNEFEEDLGTADSFGRQLELSTKAFNLDHAQAEVRVNFLVNGKLVQRHKNAKSDDPAPLIKLTMNFKS